MTGGAVLGLDLGTSSLKAAIVEASGRVVAVETAAYPVAAPRPGWSEADPEAWWDAAARAVRALPNEARRALRGVGVAGQMHGLVLCDEEGTSLRPAVLWSDGRSVAQLARYDALGDAQRRRLANPVTTGMAGPSWIWLREHEPQTVARAAWALLPKDWLRLRLTGEVGSEPSDASGTLLYDPFADGWAVDVVRALGLDPARLPSLHASDAVVGTVTATAAARLGLAPGLPVVAGAGDTPAAMLGSGVTEEGDGQLNVGTGAQLVVVDSAAGADPRRGVHLYRTCLPGQRYRMAAMQNAGLALDWVRGVLDLSWPDLYAGFEPASVPGDLAFLPYLSGERTPLLDPGARGAWTGLALHHGRRDLANAALVGVALAIRDGFRTLAADGTRPARLRLSGGGARDPRFAQLLCDLLEVPLARSDVAHATVVGAAELAWRGVGLAHPEAGRWLRDASPPAQADARTLRPRPLPDGVARMAERFAGIQAALVRRGG